MIEPASEELERKVQQLEHVEEQQQRLIEFGDLILALSTEFISLPVNEIDNAINRALKTVGEFTDADRCYVIQFSEDKKYKSNTHEWCRSGIESHNHRLRDLPCEENGWIDRRILNGEVINIPDINKMSGEAVAEREEFTSKSIKSLIAIPLSANDTPIGVIGLDSVKNKRAWTDDYIKLIKIAGQIITNALTRKSSQAALHFSEEKYKTIVETSPDAVTVSDLEGKIIFASRRTVELHGYTNEQELIGKNVLELLSPEEHERALINTHKTLERGLLRNVQYTLLRKDGSSFEGELSASVINNPDGEPSAFMAVSRDISDRKKVESLIAAERDLGLALSSRIDFQDALKECTDAALKVSGMKFGAIYLVDEETGGFDLKYYSRGFPQSFIKEVSHCEADSLSAAIVMKGEPVFSTLKAAAPPDVPVGSFRALAVIPIKHEGNVIACMNLTTDEFDEVPEIVRPQLESIGARIGNAIVKIRAEEQLRDSENKLRNIIENIPDFFCCTDFKGKILSVNTKGAQLLGYDSPEDLTGKDAAQAFYYCPADRDKYISDLLEKRILKNYEITLKRKDGTGLSVLANSQIVYDEHGKPAVVEGIARDITELKAAEERLKQSENLYKNAIVAAEAVPYYVDYKRNRYTFIGEGIESLTGYPVEEFTPELWLSLSREEVLMGEHRGMIYSEAQKMARKTNSKYWRADHKIRKRNGEEIWVADASALIRDKNGKLIASLGMLSEVTDRKNIEEELKKSEEKYRLIAENASDIIWQTDMNMNFVYVSPSVERLRGYAASEVFAQQLHDMLTPDSVVLIKKYLGVLEEKIKKGVHLDPIVVELEHTCKDGSTFWGEVNANFMYNSMREPVGMFGVTRDITERKQLLDKLQFTQSAIDRHSDEAFWINSSGRLEYVNDAACDVLGYTHDELLNMNIWDIDINYTESIWAERWENVKRVKRITVESFQRSKDNRLIPVEVSANYMMLGDNEYIVAFARDIALRQKEEDEKKKLEAQLLHAQKMESIGRLAGGIAHDFNNILTGIVGYAELLKLQFSDDSTLEGKSVDVIIEGVDRASNLTKQLLGFARRGKFNPVPVDLNNTVKQVLKMSEKIFEKNISVITEYGEINNIIADENQIEQVLTNLMINSKDAMPRGGALSIKTEEVYLDENDVSSLPGLQADYHVKFTMSDTGIGMTKDIKEHIFEPFFTTKGEGVGTGLGLATVYGIIKNHYGYIGVYSEPGEGTTFTIFLPATKEDAIRKGAEIPTIRGKATLLVIDDEENVRNILKQQLESFGYTVITAEDGNSGLKTYKKNRNKIDLVLLDMIMPNMAGKETYGKLRKLNPDVKVLLSSGYSHDDKTEEILREGVIGFVQKPFRMNELLKILNEVLTG
ncbi:PAS domain S-box protein [candidate division KSB1 bacterium]